MSHDESVRSIREVFLAALDLEDESERRVFLDEACGVATDRRGEVEQLLAVQKVGLFSPLDDAVARFVPTDLFSNEGEMQPEIDVSAHPMIGPYKIREQIGEGGFGQVFVAEQTGPVQRKVALKLIKLGMDTQEVIARFEAERQALAMMDHPHIAKVFDAGTTETGRPYFVMELIRGMPITKFCREKKLDLRNQLKLFVDVCRAVQHAHQKGIIHRDLKPSNIMITLHDGVPVVKVIDFGVAKALFQKLTEHTVYTRQAQMIGTPAYMSPEQAELSGLDVDTRSDVYSLGVLLYELLTGTPPFDQETLMSKGFDEMRRVIREDDPPRPSHRISTLDVATKSTLQKERGLDLRQFRHSLKRELDWIVMKALEKNRERRYESASDLAADVERYLSDAPVEACPPTLGYRFRKFAMRHKGKVITILLVTAALSIGSSVAVWQAVEANAARGIAIDNASAADRERILATEKEIEARQARDDERSQREKLEEEMYFADIRLAQETWEAGRLPEARELLAKHIPKAGARDFRRWEWHYLNAATSHNGPVFHDHALGIREMAWSADGRYLASFGGDGLLVVREVMANRIVAKTPIGRSTIGSVSLHFNGPWLAWAPDGKRLAYVEAKDRLTSGGREIVVWEVEMENESRRVSHKGEIISLGWGDRNQILFSEPGSYRVHNWDLQQDSVQSILRSPQGGSAFFRPILVSPNGRRLLQFIALVQPIDYFARTWDIEQGRLLGYIDNGPLSHASWDPNGKLLVVARKDSPPEIIDSETGRVIRVLGTDPAIRTAWSLHNDRIALASQTGISIWDAESGEPLTTIQGTSTGLAWHPSGHFLAVGREDGRIELMPADRSDRYVVLKLKGARYSPVHWNRAGNLLIVPMSGSRDVEGNTVKPEQVLVVDAGTKRLLARLSGSFVSESSNGRYLVTVNDATIRIWDTTNWKLAAELQADKQTLCWSHDGHHLVFVDRKREICLWSPETGRRPISKLEGRNVSQFAWGKSNRLFAYISVHSPSRNRFELKLQRFNADTGKPIGHNSLGTFDRDSFVISPGNEAQRFTQAGKLVVFVRSNQPSPVSSDKLIMMQMRIYDADTGALAQHLTFPFPTKDSARWPANVRNSVLVLGSHARHMVIPVLVDNAEADKVAVWDIEQGEIVYEHDGSIYRLRNQIQMCPDERFLKIGNAIVDLNSQQTVFTLSASQRVCFHPSERRVLICDREFGPTIHDLETGRRVLSLSGEFRTDSPPLAWSPKGRDIAFRNETAIGWWSASAENAATISHLTQARQENVEQSPFLKPTIPGGQPTGKADRATNLRRYLESVPPPMKALVKPAIAKSPRRRK